MVAPTGLLGAVPGYVQDELGNWYQVVGSPGPMGPSGPTGAVGPTGPLNTNMALDDLTDVNTPAPPDGSTIVFDQSVLPSGMWVATPMPGDEVYVEPTAPAVTGFDYAWFDLSDTGPAGPGSALVLDDLLDVETVLVPPTNKQVLAYEGQSQLWKPAGPFVHQRTGGGVTIRETSGGQQPQIEDFDGTNPRDIIDTVNGDLRYAPFGDYPTLGAWQNCVMNTALGGSVAQWRDIGGAVAVKFNIQTGQGYSSLGMPVFTLTGAPAPYQNVWFYGLDHYAGGTKIEFICYVNLQVHLVVISASRHVAGTFVYAKP